jgi:site-specific DNA-methyltransferase (adenine-specific)
MAIKRDQSQLELLVRSDSSSESGRAKRKTTKEQLQRLDASPELRARIIPYCRLSPGQIWEDPVHGHKVAVIDATNPIDVARLMSGETAQLVIADPPYNVVVGNVNSFNLSKIPIRQYIEFSRQWIDNAVKAMSADSFLYIWTGADYKDNFQPLPDLMLLLRGFPALRPKNLITIRNQRGYGTQHNWMWVRQELLCYQKGNPMFHVEAEYTDIPKILRGYYKEVNGELTENLERGKSPFIRAGNVWVDIQQVFYRMEENVPGCYAQKPLKATGRIISASSCPDDLVVDLFAHSGSALIGGERLQRRVFAADIDPIFAEISMRRLERYRASGKTGWQWENPFPEIDMNIE